MSTLLHCVIVPFVIFIMISFSMISEEEQILGPFALNLLAHLAQQSPGIFITSVQSRVGQISIPHKVSPLVHTQVAHGIGLHLSPSLRVEEQ